MNKIKNIDLETITHIKVIAIEEEICYVNKSYQKSNRVEDYKEEE